MTYRNFDISPDFSPTGLDDLRGRLLDAKRSEDQEQAALVEVFSSITDDPKNVSRFLGLFLEFEPKYASTNGTLQYLTDHLLQTALDFSIDLAIPILMKGSDILNESPHYGHLVKELKEKLRRSAPFLYSLPASVPTKKDDAASVVAAEVRRSRSYHEVVVYLQTNYYNFALTPGGINGLKCQILTDLPPAFLELAACAESEGNEPTAITTLRGAWGTIAQKHPYVIADYLAHMERLCLNRMLDPRSEEDPCLEQYPVILHGVEETFKEFELIYPYFAPGIKYLRQRQCSVEKGGVPIWPLPRVEDIMEEIRGKVDPQ